MSNPSDPATTSSADVIRPDDYSHSPVHYAVALGDHAALTRLVSSLPRLADPSHINTESESLSQERLAEEISELLDNRDNPLHETALHLAVRLNDAVAARILAVAGADISLQNAAGWSSTSEAVIRRSSEMVAILAPHERVINWSKWRRRLPSLVAAIQRMRNFYMEISFHFESSVIPFFDRMCPSDTYKIWKRDGNIRVDTTVIGFEGLKVKRGNQSFIFLGEGSGNLDLPPGSYVVLNHDLKNTVALPNIFSPMSDSEIAKFCARKSVSRPGMSVTKAELVGRTNWRRQQKTESIGEWKAKVYDVHNIIISLRSREITGPAGDLSRKEKDSPSEPNEEKTKEEFLVSENISSDSKRRRHSSFAPEERHGMTEARKSVDGIPEQWRRPVGPPQTKDTEFKKNVQPSIWLTEQFPLKMEEFLPLLDILSKKVKAFRQMRELLTTKLPPGNFPVKLAIPVVPTIRVVITFTNFTDLHQIEQFYTPYSSPFSTPGPAAVHGGTGANDDRQGVKNSNNHSFWSSASSSVSSWLPRSSGKSSKQNSDGLPEFDPFAIPSGYSYKRRTGKSGGTKKSK